MSALALVGARVWDGESDAFSERPQTLRVESGRIVALGEDPRLAEGAEGVDVSGGFALPGLIDAHVHMTLDPEVRSPDDQEKTDPDTLVRGMEARALAMAQAGITTARDLGGGRWLELTLRERIASGEVTGPRLLCAGQPVTSPKGHCWFWGGEAADEAQIRGVVRRQVEHDVDWIKVMATGGVITKGSDTKLAQFDVPALRALVEEAHAHGRPVAAHCHGTQGIDHAARARVRTIEHCSFVGDDGFGSDVDPAVIDEMTRAGLYVSPTINAGWRRFWREDGTRGKLVTRVGEALTALHRAGVPLIASTDAGIPGVAHHRLPEALGVFAELAGLTPPEVLRTATSASARALGLAEHTGRLHVGLEADVLVVDADPLADLAGLLRPRLVLVKGRRVPAAGAQVEPSSDR